MYNPGVSWRNTAISRTLPLYPREKFAYGNLWFWPPRNRQKARGKTSHVDTHPTAWNLSQTDKLCFRLPFQFTASLARNKAWKLHFPLTLAASKLRNLVFSVVFFSFSLLPLYFWFYRFVLFYFFVNATWVINWLKSDFQTHYMLRLNLTIGKGALHTWS